MAGGRFKRYMIENIQGDNILYQYLNSQESDYSLEDFEDNEHRRDSGYF